MRRGMSGTTAVIFGMLLGLIVLIIYVQIFGLVESRAEEDIRSLQSCQDGLLGTLAGTQGKCFPNPTCKTTTGYGGTEGDPSQQSGFLSRVSNTAHSYYWQNIGKGWGCPVEVQPDGSGPYCCIEVPKGSQGQNIAETYCSALREGDFAVKLADGCLPLGSYVVEAGKDVVLRYHVPQSEEACRGGVVVYDDKGNRIGELPVSFCNDPGELTGLGMLDLNFNAYKWIGEGSVEGNKDRSLLNNGGQARFNIGEISETFTITAETKYCSLDSDPLCRNKPVNIVMGGVQTQNGIEESYCVPDENWNCQPSITSQQVEERNQAEVNECNNVLSKEGFGTMILGGELPAAVCHGVSMERKCLKTARSSSDGKLDENGIERRWVCSPEGGVVRTIRYECSQWLQNSRIAADRDLPECS